MGKAKTSQRLTASPLLKRFTQNFIHTYIFLHIYEMVVGYIDKKAELSHLFRQDYF